MIKFFRTAAYIIIFFPGCLWAQSGHTISGYVKEAETGESLLGTNVYIKENLRGTNTNQYGFYSITLPDSDYTLVIAYLGFTTQEIPIHLYKDIRQNISLKSTPIETKEVTITAEKVNKNVE